MDTLKIKADKFFQLHHQKTPFIIPNPWDVGTARMLAVKGFSALATTSTGYVFATGHQEGTFGRDEVLAHCRDLVEAVSIPISADLEDGYGADLEGVRETYQAAGQIGLVGGSIEDAKIATENPVYDFDEAVDRVTAAVDAVKDLPFKFTLTARAENHLYGRPDIHDTIKRLQAYQEAGADVLFAPGLTTLDDIRAVTSSVDLPVNVVVGLKDTQFSVTELGEAGVKRISVGSALFRKAFGTAMVAADEMLATGTFDFASDAMGFGDINALFAKDVDQG